MTLAVILTIVQTLSCILIGYSLKGIVQVRKARAANKKTGILIDESIKSVSCSASGLSKKVDDKKSKTKKETPEEMRVELMKVVEERGKIGVIEGRMQVLKELV